MCGIWSLLDLTERSYQSPESTGDPNDADQTLLGLPPTSSAHGPWSPILTQAWAPSPCASCALGLSVPCPISHMRPLDLHYSHVSSLVCSPVSCCFWWNSLDGTVDGSCLQHLSLPCCAQMLQDCVLISEDTIWAGTSLSSWLTLP